MNDTVTSDEAQDVAKTQRLAFDKDLGDEDIPQFLKKSRKSKAKAAPEPEVETDPDPENVPNPTDNPPEILSESHLETPPETPKEVPQEAPVKQTRKTVSISDTALQNLAELTIEQLKAQQAEIDKRIQEKQAAEKKSVIEQIQAVVRDYNIPIEELVEALGGMKFKRKGQKAKAKYKDPATGTTWSGRGKEPAWIKGVADRTPFQI